MAYAVECGVSHNEVARHVTVYSRPTVLTALALIRRKNRVDQLLADAGIGVLTADDTEEVWLRTVSKPRRGVVIEHDEENLDQGGAPGTAERAAVAEQVAAEVVACLYDGGFELVAGTIRLTRDEAETAFAAPDARLWVEEPR
ncbi:hypothetical protein ACTD5D_40815 [Nocardia takedensis]|uniref:hypothetical protein n=1 Tax=Nocardia takedensis TaxID=259390 RepID=UPI003F760FAF